MADENLGNVYQLICQIFDRQRQSPLTDAQLLERFVASRDAAAFELLVRRHSRTVLSACRRVLAEHEAEDAVQATFLTLILKAGSISRRHSVAGWLRKVARRLALKVKAKAASQASREKQRAVPEAVDDPTPACVWQEVRSIVDEEIERLPRRYRLPFVLCHMEGKTNAEAGRELGCSASTIATRLAWARQRLAKQLNRRGVTLPAGLGAAVVWDQITAAAAVPARLISSTVRAGLAYATGGVRAGVVSASAVTLAEGVVHTMLMIKVGVGIGLVLFAGLLMGGAGVVISRKSRPPARVATVMQASASVATGAAKKKPTERRVAPPAAFEVGCHDSRKRKLKLKDKQVRLITPEGKQLLFPRDKIRRIEFAYATRRVSEDIRRQMDAAIADLGSQEYQRRAKAFAELRRLGGRASATLLKASKNQDLEVRLRAKALLTNLRDQALDKGLAVDEATFTELCQYDILYTVDAKFVGRIDAESLTLYTDRAKEVQLKVADLDFLQSLSVDVAVEFVEKLGGRVSRDEKADDRPVIAIDFSNSRRANSKNLKELRQLATPLATLQTLNLRTCQQITDASLKALTELKELRVLELSGCQQITDAGLKDLTELKELRVLDLWGCDKITDAGLKDLKELKELQELNFWNCQQITDAGLKELKEFKELRVLWLGLCQQITDAGLKELKDLKGLQTLHLSSCNRITDAGLKELKDLKELRNLNLCSCKQITDASLKELKDLKGLQTLHLSSCNRITDAGLKELKDLKDLRELDLGNCQQITDASLKELKDLKGLQTLCLSSCDRITDAGLKELKDLRELDLGNCQQITDAGLKDLKDLKELQKLSLEGCKQIRDAYLKELKNLKELRELNLRGCDKITDAGLKDLKELKQLRELNLRGCDKITDAGLKELKALKGLQTLNLVGCQQITNAAVADLQKNLPNLWIWIGDR